MCLIAITSGRLRQRVLTLDKGDAALHKFDFRPLFYLDLYSAIRQEAAPISYDLCFMGTVHSDRYSIVKSVKEWCDAHELRCYFGVAFICTCRTRLFTM
jgi:hypothetical protein